MNLPALCFASTLVFSLVTGLRLMWVARRTHGFPEWAVGAASLVLSLAGTCDAAVASTASPSGRALFGSGSHSAYSAAAMLLFIATQRIFRDRNPWALWGARFAAACVAAIAVIVVATGPHVTADGQLARGVAGGTYMVGLGVRLCAYVWLTGEALAAHRAGRRALRYGLAEPLAVHQFLLWAISAGAMGAGVFGALYRRAIHGQAVMASASGLYLFSVLGLVGAGASWLAFFPPAAYVRHVTGPERAGDG